MQVCFEYLIEHAGVQLPLGRSTSLRYLGYRSNGGRIAGVLSRPHLRNVSLVAEALCCIMLEGTGKPLGRLFGLGPAS